MSVRLGGIYALDRLMEDDRQRYYSEIMKVSAAFARKPITDDSKEFQNGVRDDVQAVMELIGRRNDPSRWQRRSGLPDADRSVLLHERGLVLLHGAQLRGAVLIHGNYREVAFTDADLTGAFCYKADFSDASCEVANFSNAKLIEVNMCRVRLTGAVLMGAILAGSNLSGADLRDADLSDADLSGSGDLPVTGLTQEQIDRAKANTEARPKLEGVVDAKTGKQLVWRGHASK